MKITDTKYLQVMVTKLVALVARLVIEMLILAAAQWGNKRWQSRKAVITNAYTTIDIDKLRKT